MAIIVLGDSPLEVEIAPVDTSDFPSEVSKLGASWCVRVYDPLDPSALGTKFAFFYADEESADLAVQALEVILGMKIKGLMTPL